MGNGRLGLQCLAPGVWDMGHLAGLPARGAGGLCGSVWSSRSLPVSSVVPRSPEVCGLGPLCLTELLALWGFLLLLLALFSEITKSRIEMELSKPAGLQCRAPFPLGLWFGVPLSD